jgi:membrane-associated PAP2 superfamily phosphatase
VRRSDVLVAALGGALLLLWDLSRGDLAVTRLFAHADGFHWRDAWLTSVLLHQGGRIAAWGVLLFLVADALRPIVRGPTRAERWRGLLATLACLLLVPALKQVSATSCPWDLAEFGGTAAYVPHWWFGVADGGPGRCFPSGHAVGAFAFFSGHFLLREHRPLAARRWLAGVCLAGLLFGGAQLARGAHHVSHTLWSAWLCWLICTAFSAWRMPLARPAVLLAAPNVTVGASDRAKPALGPCRPPR